MCCLTNPWRSAIRCLILGASSRRQPPRRFGSQSTMSRRVTTMTWPLTTDRSGRKYLRGLPSATATWKWTSISRKVRRRWGHGDLTEDEAPDDPLPAFDWRWMVMTVALQTDYRPSITMAGVASGGGQKKLVLRVPGAHYWIAPHGAVVDGVTVAGKLSFYTGPWASRTAALPADFPTEGILRNDMPRLVDIALLASVWYGRERAAITVTKTGILDVFPLGTWIRECHTGSEQEQRRHGCHDAYI